MYEQGSLLDLDEKLKYLYNMIKNRKSIIGLKGTLEDIFLRYLFFPRFRIC